MISILRTRCVLAACLLAGCTIPAGHGAPPDQPEPWKRHTIDNSSKGADGVRLADANGDGQMDIATGWEQGGVIRVCINPGHARAKDKWPAVTVGKVNDAEDAVFVDLDGDGALDVVSSCEGKTRTMYVHWAPKEKSRYLDPAAWKTEPIPATQDKQMWMYCLPMQVDGRHGIDLVVGSKGDNGCVGWLESPGNPRDLAAWKLHRLRDAAWIMSLIAADMDGDGDEDILFSDRYGKASGAYWLQKPTQNSVAKADVWRQHTIGCVGKETMFLAHDALEARGPASVVAVVKPNVVQWLKPPAKEGGAWESSQLTCDTQRFGRVKAVRAGDLDGDGKAEFVITCEGAKDAKSGVYYIVPPAKPQDEPRFVDIGGAEGYKYDRIELIDLDGDGDLDVLTCEESDNLGVIWYENPRAPSR